MKTYYLSLIGVPGSIPVEYITGHDWSLQLTEWARCALKEKASSSMCVIINPKRELIITLFDAVCEKDHIIQKLCINGHNLSEIPHDLVRPPTSHYMDFASVIIKLNGDYVPEQFQYHL